jgi:hypothetical protein
MKIHFLERTVPLEIVSRLALEMEGTLPTTGLTAEKVAITHLAQASSI